LNGESYPHQAFRDIIERKRKKKKKKRGDGKGERKEFLGASLTTAATRRITRWDDEIG